MVRRIQHSVTSGVICMVGIWILYLSFTQEPSEAFLFPRLVSIIFVLLALWTFIKACLGRSKVGTGLNYNDFMQLLPGLLVSIVYVFWLAKFLGFYAALFLCSFTLLVLYDPASHHLFRSWIKRLVITSCFTAVMYILFYELLQVYTPKGYLF